MPARRLPLRIVLLVVFFWLQVAFWWQTHTITPRMEIVPEPPTLLATRALSFGDSEFLFRYYGFQLQNFGDTFGRFTPLKDYDYKRLSRWLHLADELDDRSNLIAALAAYYYSQTQNKPDTRYVIEYLEHHYDRNPQKKWWWLGQAAFLADFKLKDQELALRLAYKLAATPGDLPFWARQLPAFIHEKRGEYDAAFHIIEGILQDYQNIPVGELNFMRYFIEERLRETVPEALDDRIKSSPPLEAPKEEETAPTP